MARIRMQNMPKHAQKHAPEAILTCLWEFLCEPLLLLGQFHGYTYLLKGQFRGICLEESQPPERTFAGQVKPLKRTFGRVNAPDKRTSAFIPWDFPTRTHRPGATIKNVLPGQNLRRPTQRPKRCAAPPGRKRSLGGPYSGSTIALPRSSNRQVGFSSRKTHLM